MKEDKPNRFEQAGEGRQATLWGELVHFLRQNKKFWLIPLLIVLLILAVLIIFSATAAAPFIYTLF